MGQGVTRFADTAEPPDPRFAAKPAPLIDADQDATPQV